VKRSRKLCRRKKVKKYFVEDREKYCINRMVGKIVINLSPVLQHKDHSYAMPSS